MKLSKKGKIQIAILLLPGLIIFGVFTLYPILKLFIMSFFQWNFGSMLDKHFIGLENYKEVLKDSYFRTVFINTLAVNLKLINSLVGLIPFYVAWTIPYSSFMIKGFVEGLPEELDEATYIDGGSVFTVFSKIIIPLARPGIASVSIFNFLTAWEEFPWANTVINDNLKRTLPIAISGFFGEHQFTQWGYVFALSVFSLLPILIVFISCQKFFVSGLTTGSVKG